MPCLSSKNECRIYFRQTLKNLTEYEKSLQADAVCEKVLNWKIFGEAEIVLSYAALKNELNPEKIIRSCENEKIFYLPRVIPDTNRMNFYRVVESGIVMLKKGSFGIPEPVESEENLFVPENIYGKKILVLVPGMAFCKNGSRLGKGKGFYDIYLERLKKACEKNENSLVCAGICFDEQITDGLPVTQNDISMDFVISRNFGIV